MCQCFYCFHNSGSGVSVLSWWCQWIFVTCQGILLDFSAIIASSWLCQWCYCVVMMVSVVFLQYAVCLVFIFFIYFFAFIKMSAVFLSHVSGVIVFITVSVVLLCFHDAASGFFVLSWLCQLILLKFLVFFAFMKMSVEFLSHVNGIIVFITVSVVLLCSHDAASGVFCFNNSVIIVTVKMLQWYFCIFMLLFLYITRHYNIILF